MARRYGLAVRADRLRRGLIRRRHHQSAEGTVSPRTSGQIDKFDRRILIAQSVVYGFILGIALCCCPAVTPMTSCKYSATPILPTGSETTQAVAFALRRLPDLDRTDPAVSSSSRLAADTIPRAATHCKSSGSALSATAGSVDHLASRTKHHRRQPESDRERGGRGAVRSGRS